MKGKLDTAVYEFLPAMLCFQGVKHSTMGQPDGSNSDYKKSGGGFPLRVGAFVSPTLWSQDCISMTRTTRQRMAASGRFCPRLLQASFEMWLRYERTAWVEVPQVAARVPAGHPVVEGVLIPCSSCTIHWHAARDRLECGTSTMDEGARNTRCHGAACLATWAGRSCVVVTFLDLSGPVALSVQPRRYQVLKLVRVRVRALVASLTQPPRTEKEWRTVDVRRLRQGPHGRTCTGRAVVVNEAKVAPY